MRTLAFALLATLAFGGFASAHACSCGYEAPGARDAAVNLIVEAHITAISEMDQNGNRYADITTIQTQRGPRRARYRIHYNQGDGANCGARFTLGETTTVYAQRTGRDEYYSSYCLLPGTSRAERLAFWRAREAEFQAHEQGRPYKTGKTPLKAPCPKAMAYPTPLR